MKKQTGLLIGTVATAIASFGFLAPAQAISFGSDFIQGDGSQVDFTFRESHGYFQSEWGVYNNTTNTFYTLLEEVRRNDGVNAKSTDNMGTCGTTVLNCTASFTFEDGNEYSFFLRNIGEGDHKKTVFSANQLNPIQGWTTFEDQTKFFFDLSVLDDTRYQTDDSLSSDLATTRSESVTLENGMTILIGFEDQGVNPNTGEYFHGDWNDFIVTAQVQEVPEPITGLVFAAAAGGFALRRAKKKSNN